MRLVHSVSHPLHRERAVPNVIAVGNRPFSAWFARWAEIVLARLGRWAGRVPAGVTPTLATSRWWR
jgi:hypothetical protein